MAIRSYFCCAAYVLVSLACGTACLAADGSKFKPGRVIPLLGDGEQNLVPNASFECGTDGWGSTEMDVLPGWYGTLNRLFGQLDSTTAADGHASLKIELSPDNLPIAYNDYLHTQRIRIKAPLAASVGWIIVEPGQAYTFSVVMKAAKADTPARLVVRQFHAAPVEKLVKLTTDWQRYSLDFTAAAAACYVLAGPDLRATEDNPNPPEQATVWLDAVQLAPAETKTPFATRQPVEFGVSTDMPGNVFAWEEPLQWRLKVASADAKQERKAEIDMRLTDFFDEEVWHETRSVTVPPGSSQELTVTVPPSTQLRGYLLLHATLTSGSIVEPHNLRLAVIPTYQDSDSRFGMNHAFGWPDMLALCKRAGLCWMRDWSMKWQDVEPQQGQFDYEETDAQVGRLFQQGFHVDEVLPFPSTLWSTTAPASVGQNNPWYAIHPDAPDYETRYDQILAERGSRIGRLGYAPRDMKEFQDYVGRTVDRYKDHIHHWQVFNEPLLTGYALPRRAGYSAADYLKYVEAFVEAARRSDSTCTILGGFNYEGKPGALDVPLEFINLGGTKHLDVFTLHSYPMRNRPEFIEPVLQQVGAAMEEHGGRKPIWFTEFAYYADDDPWGTPMVGRTSQASELIQAVYEVRFCTTCVANGVEKIFFHAGTGSAINHSNLWTMFLRYNSEPFKNYATQAVMSQMLTPSCKFVKHLLPDEPLKACLFRDTKRTVAVVWTPSDTKPSPVELTNAKLQLWDIVGRPQKARTFTPSGSPVYITGDGVSAEEFEKGVVVGPQAKQ